MTGAAKIDVLIPAYNSEATVREALASIQRQTIRDIRLIVVNDGSTDGTGAVLREIAAEDSRVLLVETSNGGIVSALNKAIELSTAPFLARHDTDDIAFPERFERQLAYFDASPDCVAVSANAWFIGEDGRRLGSQSQFAGDVRPDAHALPSEEPYLMHPFLMVRRETMQQVGGYRYVFHAEDTDLYWRLLPLGRLHSLPDLLGEYRMNPNSVSSASVQNGRVAATYSQLAAISHLRRERGELDLPFRREDMDAMRRLGSLTEIVAFAARMLSAAEAEYLRLAVAAKLLRLASYRPYLLEAGDCRFIARALPQIQQGMAGKQRLHLTYHQAHVLRRLVGNRRWGAVRAMHAAPSVYLALIPAMLARHVKAAATRVRRG